MAVNIRSSITGSKLPSPYDLLQTLKDLAAGINAAEAKQTTFTQQITNLGDQVSTVINAATTPPTPIGPFPSVIVGVALSGNGTAGSPLDVLVDGTTVIVNGSNQLEAVIPPDVITGTLVALRIPYALSASVLTDDDAFTFDPTTTRLRHSIGGFPTIAGVGTVNLFCAGDFGLSGAAGHIMIDGYANPPNLSFRRSDGDATTPVEPGNGAVICNLRALAWDGSAMQLGGFFRYATNGTWVGGANRGMDFQVYLTATGSVAAPAEVFRVTTEGLRIGLNIGTVATTGVIRIPNAQAIYSRGSTAVDVRLIGTSGANVVSVGDSLRTCQFAEVWETEAGNGDFRPVTNNARNLGGSARIILNTFTSKLTNPPQPTTSTGNQAAFAVTSTCLRANNASLLTLQGIVAGATGQDLEIWAIGAGAVDIANASGSAAAADQILTPTGATVTVTAAVGYAKLRYDGTTVKWRLLHST